MNKKRKNVLLFIFSILLCTSGYGQNTEYAIEIELIAETKKRSLLSQVVDLDVKTDKNGRNLVYVADVFTSAVLVLEQRDDKLELINRLGREGMGPGEFIELTNVELIPEQDILMIYDGSLARVTLMDLTTKKAEKVINLDYRRGAHFPMEIHSSSAWNGQFYARGDQFFSDDYTTGVQRHVVLQIYNQEGTVWSDSLLVKPADDAFVFLRRGNMSVNPQPVWGQKSIFQFKKNRIYYGWTGNPEIVVYDQKGRHVQSLPLHELQQLKITAEDRKLALEREASIMEERASVLRRSFYDAMPTDFWPWFYDFIIDEKLRGWIALPTSMNSKTRTWQLRNLENKGVLIGEVQLPANFTVHQIKNNIIAGELFNFDTFRSTVQLYQLKEK